jgi:hypothetical protein
MQYYEVAFPRVSTVTMTVHNWKVIDDSGGSRLMAVAEFQASASAPVRSFVRATALPRLTIGKPNLQLRAGACSTCSRGQPEFQTLLRMRLRCQGVDIRGQHARWIVCVQRLSHRGRCIVRSVKEGRLFREVKTSG